MKTTRTSLMALISAISLVAPMAAFAQQGKPPAPPSLAEMATALGVSEASAKSCLPAPPQGGDQSQGGQSQGSQSQGKPAKPDATAIASCLTAAGEKVTEAKVEKALAKFAPPMQKKN